MFSLGSLGNFQSMGSHINLEKSNINVCLISKQDSYQSLLNLLNQLDLEQLQLASDDGNKHATLALALVYGRTCYSGIPHNPMMELLMQCSTELPTEAYTPQIITALNRFDGVPVDLARAANYLLSLITENRGELVESVWDGNDLAFGLLQHCSSEQLEQMALTGNKIAVKAWDEKKRLDEEFHQISNFWVGLSRNEI